MADRQPTFKGMSLFTECGERKYLSQIERARFYDALAVLADPVERSFCETIFWTGCRPSEALALRAANFDLDDCAVIVRSLKKRGKNKGRHFRPVPVPRTFMAQLDEAHGIRRAQNHSNHGRDTKMWTFSRTTGWRLIRVVMDAAEVTGVKACAKGLRHAYGVHAAIHKIPETRIKKWLGHESLETTEVYLDVVGPEDHAIARRMWGA